MIKIASKMLDFHSYYVLFEVHTHKFNLRKIKWLAYQRFQKKNAFQYYAYLTKHLKKIRGWRLQNLYKRLTVTIPRNFETRYINIFTHLRESQVMMSKPLWSNASNQPLTEKNTTFCVNVDRDDFNVEL